MVQISEYTRRDLYQPTSRGRNNLQLPDAIVRAESSKGPLSNDTINNLRIAAKGGKEVADAMVVMKENYDQAKVNEYINNYMTESNKTILGYQQNRKGRNANGLLQDFEQYSENYFSKAMGNKDNDSEKPLLENKEQIELARATMDKLNVSYVNQISNYQAKELQEYKDNQASAVASNLLTSMSLENNPTNITNYIQLFKGTMASQSKYKGQSSEYINQNAKALVTKALGTNIQMTAIKNPELAIAKMQDPTFKNHMDDVSYEQLKQQVATAAIDYWSTQSADDIANGQTQTMSIAEKLDNPFFDGFDKAILKNTFVQSSEKKAKAQIETQQVEEITYKNNLLANSELSEDGTLDTNTVENLGSAYLGAETVKMFADASNKYKTEKYDIDNGIPIASPSQEQIRQYNIVESRIRDGSYRDVSDMKEDIEGLNGSMQIDILRKFIDNQKYKKTSSMLKVQGIDIDKQAENQFKMLTNLSPSTQTYSYDAFQSAFMDKVTQMNSMGEKLDTNALKDIASSVLQETFTATTPDAQARRTMYNFDQIRGENIDKTGVLSNPSKMKEWALEAIDNSIDTSFSKQEKNELAEYIVRGDVNGARLYINSISEQAKQAKAKRQEEEQKKYNKTIQEMLNSGLVIIDDHTPPEQLQA